MIKKDVLKSFFKFGGRRKFCLLIFIILISFIFIGSVLAIPGIEFVDPTPADGIKTTNTSIEINVSITEADLKEFKFNWNNVDYTFYNDSLVLMMNFDNISALGENDTYVADVSGNGNNGTVYNGTIICGQTADCPNWTSSGKYGGAYEFDGSNDYVSVADDDSLDFGNGTFSVGLWINPLSNTGVDIGIIEKGDGDWSSASGTGYYFGPYSSSQYAFIMDDGTTGDDRINFGDLSNLGWQHIVITVDDANDVSPMLRGYKNGVEVINVARSNALDSISNANDFKIGVGFNSYYFNGSIDEVFIWNRTLSADEIEKLYYSNLRKYDTDKWSFYKNETNLTFSDNNYFAMASNLSGSENLTETRIITLSFKTTQYYDNRTMVVVWTNDDVGAGDINYHINASNYAQSKKVVFSPTIITGSMSPSEWTAIQTEIDEGFVSPVSHSVNHETVPYTNTTLEVCGSQSQIIENLELSWQNRFNGSEYIVGWIAPSGASDSIVRGNLSECNYLCHRTGGGIATWAPWNSSEGLYERYGSAVDGDSANLTTLNSTFDTVYSDRGIYHFFTHAYNLNWTDTDKIPQHLDYIGNRTDVWYVGWGQLYMYHYLEDRLKPDVNFTTQNNQIITVEINTSGTERNKYGLSYPVTYVFAIPSVWSNAFVFYKNTSSDDYTAMTEKTSSDFFNGIDAYRTNLSENGVYVSKGFPQEYNEFYLKIVPILSTNFTGSITDLTEGDLSNITNLTIENPSYGKINFSESVNLSAGGDLNTYVTISQNYISIDSTNLPALNKSATLTLYSLSFSDPRILKDGEVCSSDICTGGSYTSDGNLTFSVTSFSIYSAGETPVRNTLGDNNPSTYTGIDTSNLNTYWLFLRHKLKFTLNNKIHFIKPTYISSNFVDLEISSEPIKVKINLGEFKLIDLDKDNINDIKITLNNIQGTKVSLTIDYLNDKIKQTGIIEEEKQEEVQEEEIIEEKPLIQIREIEEKSKKELFIILGFIIALVIFYFKTQIISFLFKNKKKK